MAKPALLRDESQVAEDGLADGQAGMVPGEISEDACSETAGVVRPFVKKGGRRIREMDAVEEWSGNLFRRVC